MELHWFYKAWRIRAARVRKTGFLQIPQQLFLCFRWKYGISHKKVEFQETSPFCMSPECLGNQCFLDAFSSGRAHFQVASPFFKKTWNSAIFSVSGPKSALFGPEWDFGGPCVKPFINTTFWEVFWRPRTGKVHFSPKNWKFRPKTGNSQKMRFLRGKVILLQQCAKPHEVLPFLL